MPVSSFEDYFRWRRRKALGLPNPKKLTPAEAAAAANEAAYQKELAEARERGRQLKLSLCTSSRGDANARRKAERWGKKLRGKRTGSPEILLTPAKREPKQLKFF